MVREFSFEEIKINNLRIFKVRYRKNLPTNKITEVNRVVLHHTKNRSTLKSIYNLHVLENGWSKIGYHFVISKSGKIYQTRDLLEEGAHAYGSNATSLGVALVGNFDVEKPTLLQLYALRRLLKVLFSAITTLNDIVPHNQVTYDYLLKKFDLSLPHVNFLRIKDIDTFEKVKKKLKLQLNRVSVPKLTTCPGVNFYPIVEELKKEFIR